MTDEPMDNVVEFDPSRERLCRSETCGNCRYFYKVYGDMPFGGCHLKNGGSQDPADACDINRYEARRPKETEDR